ncbi:MAG TPA: hypothetical protein VEG28_03760, partial [Dehalococcoidia bacterium]|nr:hypothetical protein [Dehalococcoidia bacterium]
MEGTLNDNPHVTYGAPGQEVLLMSLSTSASALYTKTGNMGTLYCVFYAPYGSVGFKNFDTVSGAVIGQGIYSHNGFSATWTTDVYSIPGLPGGYVSQGNNTNINVQQVAFSGAVIDWYKVCYGQSCNP